MTETLDSEQEPEMDTVEEEEESDHEVQDMLENLGSKIQDAKTTLNGTKETLKQMVARQKELLRLGQLVGEKGRPHQMVADANLAERCGAFSTSTIRAIRVTNSIWNAKRFAEKVCKNMRGITSDPVRENGASDGQFADSPKAADMFASLFLTCCQPGLVPDLAVVQGAYNTSVIPGKKSKAGKSTERKGADSDDTDRDSRSRKKRFYPGPGDKPAKLQRMMAEDMNANTDPTMAATGQLYDQVMESYLLEKKPVSVLHLCTDTTSFQKTVENFFCFSFLLRDDLVRLYLNADRVPVCVPLKFSEEEDNAAVRNTLDTEDHAVQQYTALMMNLTPSKWKDLLEAVSSKTDEVILDPVNET